MPALTNRHFTSLLVMHSQQFLVYLKEFLPLLTLLRFRALPSSPPLGFSGVQVPGLLVESWDFPGFVLWVVVPGCSPRGWDLMRGTAPRASGPTMSARLR
jgi:hypothetical protein